MNNKDEDFEYISTQEDADLLASQILAGKSLAYNFKFSDRDYFVSLLALLNIDYDEFVNKYFYFDPLRRLHISESEFGHVWISTYGLIARKKATNNPRVNACANQYVVISLLLDKALEVTGSETVYDIDRYNSGILNELSPALFQNLVFYVEVFCKAYLALSQINPPHKHELTLLYAMVKETMFAKHHNDTLFHEMIVQKIAKIVDHLTNISGDFKEHFIKYDANPDDSTIIIFSTENLAELKTLTELCNDFILEYFYRQEECHDLRPGLYQRLMDKAQSDEEKNKVAAIYGHLLRP